MTDQKLRKNGMKFKGCKIGLKKRISSSNRNIQEHILNWMGGGVTPSSGTTPEFVSDKHKKA